MDTNFYDVIICGGELAGVVAAALMGRRGMRVLLLGHDLQRPSFEAGPFTLSRGPALLPSLGSEALGRVLKGLGAVTLARACLEARQGQYRIDGAEAGLWGLFLEKIETFSGERREKVLPVEIVLQRGKAVGLRVRPRDETIGCKTLVWAAPAASALPLLGESPTRRARDAAQALRPVCYRYTLALLVRPEALPEGMGARVFVIADPKRAPLEENTLAVTVGQVNPREPDREPVWVEALVPAAAVEAGPGHLAALRAREREQLGRLMPFFDRHLLVLASPHDGLPPELPGAPGKPMPIAAQPMAPVYSAEHVRSFDPAW